MQTAKKKWKPQTKTEAIAVIEEVQRRGKLKHLTLVDDKFEAQAKFLRDPARRKAAKCTRRAGKTTGVARALIETCIKNDDVAVLYIGLTFATCRRVFWEDALKPTLKLVKSLVKYKTISSRLEVHFPNGSRIYCLGMDSDKEQMQKLLGGKYKRVVIDEAGSFRVDLKTMIDEMIWPALADLEGDLWLTGTPTDYTAGFFHAVTRDDGQEREPDWSVHEWSGADNPYMARQWARELADIFAKRPRFAETPAFKRMWLGQWVIDDNMLVYKFNFDRNWVKELPGELSDYIFGLGVDLGFDDESTFVLSAYSGRSKTLYFMKPQKHAGMDITAVADKIKEYLVKYDIYSLVVDGSNKQAVEEMRRRHALPLEAADKAGKANFIDIFNSELISGDIKLVGEETDIISWEWMNLVWDEKKFKEKGKREEHPGCDNHLADACLYIWRKQRQYLYRDPIVPRAKTEEERMDEWEEAEAKRGSDDDLEFWERSM